MSAPNPTPNRPLPRPKSFWNAGQRLWLKTGFLTLALALTAIGNLSLNPETNRMVEQGLLARSSNSGSATLASSATAETPATATRSATPATGAPTAPSTPTPVAPTAPVAPSAPVAPVTAAPAAATFPPLRFSLGSHLGERYRNLDVIVHRDSSGKISSFRVVRRETSSDTQAESGTCATCLTSLTEVARNSLNSSPGEVRLNEIVENVIAVQARTKADQILASGDTGNDDAIENFISRYRCNQRDDERRLECQIDKLDDMIAACEARQDRDELIDREDRSDRERDRDRSDRRARSERPERFDRDSRDSRSSVSRGRRSFCSRVVERYYRSEIRAGLARRLGDVRVGTTPLYREFGGSIFRGVGTTGCPRTSFAVLGNDCFQAEEGGYSEFAIEMRNKLLGLEDDYRQPIGRDVINLTGNAIRVQTRNVRESLEGDYGIERGMASFMATLYSSWNQFPISRMNPSLAFMEDDQSPGTLTGMERGLYNAYMTGLRQMTAGRLGGRGENNSNSDLFDPNRTNTIDRNGRGGPRSSGRNGFQVPGTSRGGLPNGNRNGATNFGQQGQQPAFGPQPAFNNNGGNGFGGGGGYPQIGAPNTGSQMPPQIPMGGIPGQPMGGFPSQQMPIYNSQSPWVPNTNNWQVPGQPNNSMIGSPMIGSPMGGPATLNGRQVR